MKGLLFFLFAFAASLSTAMVIQPRAPVLSDVLDEHNSFRAQHGANPLVWNDTLATAAQTFASKCVFSTSGGRYGENVAAGAGDGYSALSAVFNWEEGASEYDPKNPTANRDALAFTQMVWKSSQRLGCAAVQCGDKIFGPSFPDSLFVVCEYEPRGNVIGRFDQNVQL